jgi:glycerol kinase
MRDYIGAIDQGTSSTRFLIFDGAGAVVASAQKEHAQIYPRAGWVEHDPAEILTRVDETVSEALADAGLKAADLAAVGITNQRETTVLWERATGRPVANAIVWQDTRVSELVAEFERDARAPAIREKTGLPLSTYFSSLKIRWLLDRVPGLRERAEAGEILFGTIDSFLVWHLTGGLHITDCTNASRTQLMNLETLDWDDDLLAAFDIPRQILPAIRSSSEIYGEVTAGPLCGASLAGILGDQQAALAGQSCFEPGQAKNTYGTGCFLLMNTGTKIVRSKCGLLTTVAFRRKEGPAAYALEGSVAVTGALVQWLRDNFGLIEKSADIEPLARTVEDNGGVYIVPAFSGLFAPYWKHGARGVVAGLTRYANKGHLARAALEATAFQTRDVFAAMEEDAGFPLEVLRVDGGMVENGLLMQFQADVLGREVARPAMKETTALGAAYAAGLAVGFFESTEELCARWSAGQAWKPEMDSSRREDLYRCWKKAVERSFDWA